MGQDVNSGRITKIGRGEGSRGLTFHPVIPRHASEVRLGYVRFGAGEPAAGARGLGCDINLPQGLETWVVTSAPRRG